MIRCDTAGKFGNVAYPELRPEPVEGLVEVREELRKSGRYQEREAADGID